MTMDPKVDRNPQISKIKNHIQTNIAEFSRSSPPNHKYTPPSPTTSGYSESGSEIDHDSGRVSEMENSPKTSKRPNAISLSMGVFNSGELNRISPTLEVDGTSTIKIKEAPFSKVTKKLSEDYALPLDAFAKNGPSSEKNSSDQAEATRSANSVQVNSEILRKLVLCVQDTQNRLTLAENKIEILTRALEMMKRSSNSNFTKLSRTLVALGSDFNQYKSRQSKTLPGQRQQDYIPQIEPHVDRHQVPYSKNNNNMLSFKSYVPRFHSSECLHSSGVGNPKVPNGNTLTSTKYTATFPKAQSPKLDKRSYFTPLSLAPPPGVEEESYDNVTDDGATCVDHIVTNSTTLSCSYLHDNSVKSSQSVDEKCVNQMGNNKAPIYAVVRKKKGLSKSKSKDDQTASITLPERNVQESSCKSEGDDLHEMIKELTEGDSSSSFANANHKNNAKRLSGFSDAESFVSLIAQSPSYSERRTSIDEEFTEDVLKERYDNKNWDEKMPEKDTEITTASELPSVDNIYTRDPALPPRMKENKDDNNIDKSRERSKLSTSLEHRDRFPSPVLRIKTTWHEKEHHETPYASIPNVKKASGPKTRAKRLFLSRGKSVDAIHENSSWLQPMNDTEKSPRKSTKKSAEGKKANVLITNYNRLFKRKHKSDEVSLRSFAESQDSFTFIVSPLHRKAERRESRSKRFFRRNRSVDSPCVSREFDGSSSFSNLSSSREGSLDLISPVDQSQKKHRGPLVSSANKLLYRLQSPVKLPDFVPSETESEVQKDSPPLQSSDAQSDPRDDEMRPNLVNLVKSAFRNTPELPRKTKSNGYVAHSTDDFSPIMKNCRSQSEVQFDTVDGIVLYDVPKAIHRLPDDNFQDDVFIPPGVVLDTLQREQAERMRFESEARRATDEPPPKPNRPGFSHGSPVSSTNSHGSTNGSVHSSGMHQRGMPVVPPKNQIKIMTTEELTNHEAQEMLRLKQVEEALLQQKLGEQQKEAEENAAWLVSKEQIMSYDEAGSNNGMSKRVGSNKSLTEVAPPPPNVAPSKPPRKTSRPKDSDVLPPQPKPKFEEVKTAPTMQLNRDNDDVYKDTMDVVKAVLGMNQITMNAKPEELFASVKIVGAALKKLCTSLEGTLPTLPEEFHREIDMAQKTTNKDLSQVINQLKLVQRFFTTTQVVDYKKCLMAANQVLAIDAKNLLDVVDRARINKMQSEAERASLGATSQAYDNDSRPNYNSGSYEPENFYPVHEVNS